MRWFREAGVDRAAYVSRSTEAAVPTPDRKSAATNVRGAVPLTPNQRRLWFAHRSGAGASYTISVAYRIVGNLDRRAFEAAVRKLASRHDALRTAFVDPGGDLVGMTLDFSSSEVTSVDLRGLPCEVQEERVETCIREQAARPFEFDGSELFRVALYQLDETRFVLHFTIHHILCDQWSLELLSAELFTIYLAEQDGRPVSLPDSTVSYIDLPGEAPGEDHEQERLFWTRELQGVPHFVDLPYDGPPDHDSRWSGERHYVSYSDLGEAVQRFASKHDCTAFAVLLAAFAIVYSRWLRCRDVCLGIRVAGRVDPATAAKVGFFVNLVPMHFRVPEHSTLSEWLTRAQTILANYLEHQETPFETILGWLKCDRDPLLSSLIPVTITYQNVPSANGGNVAGLSIAPIKHHNGKVKSELDLAFEGVGETLELAIEHRSDLFDWSTVAALVESHRAMLRAILEMSNDNARVRLDELPDTFASGRSAVRGRSQQMQLRSIDAELRFRAALAPNAVAVVDDDGSCTFAELDESSREIAGYLLTAGRGHRAIGICIRPSRLWFQAALACLRAGVPFVAIDPSQSNGYAEDLLHSSGATLLICDPDLAARPWVHKRASVTVAHMRERPVAADIRLPGIDVDSMRVALMLFTSGSTGKSKGVCVEYRQIYNCVNSLLQSYPMDSDEIIGQRTSVNFAPMIKEWLSGLYSGRPIAVIPPDHTVQPERLNRYVYRFGVTRLNTVPSQLRLMIDYKRDQPDAFASLGTIVVAGEPLTAALANDFAQLFSAVRLINNYGCTELNDICYSEAAPAGECHGQMPAGPPIANTSVYLLDEKLQPVPRGHLGEVYVNGPSVGQGYLGPSDATSGVFLPDPFARAGGSRMFRTGDFARELPNGGIEYRGRRDQQIKINGCRVDTAHVSNVLLEHPAIAGAAVRMHPGIYGEPVLVAYVCPVLDETLRVNLRSHLTQKLPRYMVPSCIIDLSALPTLATGKLDSASLPIPDWRTLKNVAITVEPRTPTERLLADIWMDVLERDRVGVHDNFFEAGGHSVLIIRVLTRLQDALQVKLEPQAMFECPTIAELAVRVDIILELMPAERVAGEEEGIL